MQKAPGESYRRATWLILHTIPDLLGTLREPGVEPWQVRWIIVEASHDVRSERNRGRSDTVSTEEFDRYAADGGDLDPHQQTRLEEQGTVVKRVASHHDVERFRADIIAAFQGMFGDVLAGGP